MKKPTRDELLTSLRAMREQAHQVAADADVAVKAAELVTDPALLLDMLIALERDAARRFQEAARC